MNEITTTTPTSDDVIAWAYEQGFEAFTVTHTADCDRASTGDGCVGGCTLTAERKEG